jgi:hypothetical protein
VEYKVGDLLTHDYSDSIYLVVECSQPPTSKFIRSMVVLCLETKTQEEVVYYPKSNGFNLFDRIYKGQND